MRSWHPEVHKGDVWKATYPDGRVRHVYITSISEHHGPGGLILEDIKTTLRPFQELFLFGICKMKPVATARECSQCGEINQVDSRDYMCVDCRHGHEAEQGSEEALG